jgi:hypothetical protein
MRDIGTHGSPPTRVLEVPVKRTRPVRSPIDLQVDPETLSTTRRPWKTPSDLIKIPEDSQGLQRKALP